MTGRPRVALVAAVDVDSGHGGGPMRARALRTALSTFADVLLLRARCAHDGPCRTRLALPADPFAAYFCDRTLERIHQEISAWPANLVVVTEIQIHRYATELAQRVDAPVVFDMHNVEYPLRREMAERAPAGSWPAMNFTSQHWAAVRTVEHDTIRAVDQVWTCSQTDKDVSQVCYPDVSPDKIRIVPNAVQLPAAGPSYHPRSSVVFTGRLDYYPNLEAVRLLALEIAPGVLRSCPGLNVVVAGAAVTDETLEDLAAGDIVLVQDPVDTMSLIRDSIMAVPLRLGGGSRFKVLEALSVGSPVVSTTKGAEGLDLVPGTHFLKADSGAAMVDAIVTVFSSPRLRTELGRAGFDLVRRRYSLEAVAEAVERHVATLG